MVIHPEVIVTPDCPTIKFRQPKDQIDLDRELPRILQTQGWGCGTYFHVQLFNHDKTKLLASALYVVTEEVETLSVSEDQYRPVTRTVFNRKASLVGGWWEHLEKEIVEIVEAETPIEADAPMTVTEVITATEVIRRRGRPPKNAAQPNQPA